jgi:hypothetical protein
MFNFSTKRLLLSCGKDSYWIGAWVGTTASLYAGTNRKTSTPAKNRTQAIQPTIIHCNDRAMMAPVKFNFVGLLL